jgi:2-octaprenylphenol hydroxylase
MAVSDQAFDITIIGGAMVGAALACSLRGKGWRVALIEGQPPRRDWPAGEVDLRVSALSRASQRILERLGAWPRMRELGVSPYREMVVWDAVGRGSIHFDSADIGEADLGHIVENRVTRLALWEQLEQTPDVTLICPAAVQSVEADEARAVVTLDDGRQIETRLLVGADGRESIVRSTLGIACTSKAYDQRAIVANVEVGHWHRETAWQRFLPTGPLAFLPLADGRCSIVWSAEEQRANKLLALDDAAFSTELEEAIEQRLGSILSIGPRASFPLRLQHAKEYVRPRAVLIGDAAHTVHPLAGQGVNLGFLDVAALADALDHARTKGRDIGSLHILRRYERARRGDNAAMLTAMDMFKHTFSNRNPALAATRSLGLFAADHIGPIKRAFMEQAMGLSNALPPLARVG